MSMWSMTCLLPFRLFHLLCIIGLKFMLVNDYEGRQEKKMLCGWWSRRDGQLMATPYSLFWEISQNNDQSPNLMTLY